MSQSRADYLVHAARASTPADSLTLLEGALRNTSEAQTAATSLVYLELFNDYLTANHPADAASTAERFWAARPSFAETGAAQENAAANAEYQAVLCYRAANLATQQGRSADADLWMHRAIEAAPQSRTAATIRQQLHVSQP